MNTWKNKMLALAMLLCGVLGVVFVHDATALIFVCPIAVPLLFIRENCVD